MEDDSEKLDQYVEDLLQERRPERTPLAGEEALHARQTAAMLHAAKPGVGLPSAEFRQQMERSIHGRVREQTAEPAAAGFTRRAVILSALGSLAAGAVAALGIERLIRRPAPASHDAPLVGQDRGQWMPVLALDQLSEGKPVRFGAGGIEGYLVREGDRVRALSAVCTHMGCLINWSTFRDRFECPCHGATFEKSGAPSPKYVSTLKSLPRLEVRVQEGQVEVFSV